MPTVTHNPNGNNQLFRVVKNDVVVCSSINCFVYFCNLEIGRLTSEQKSEFTGTRHGVTDSERDNATTGTSRITMMKIKYKYLETETIRKIL